jgi:hypothetical protein
MAGFLVFGAVPARAHLGSTKFVHLERTDTGAVAEIFVDAIDVSMELGLGEDADEAAIAARSEAVERWLAGGIALRAGDEPCEASAAFRGFVTRDDRRFARIEQRWRCPGRAEAAVLRDETVFPDDAQHEVFVRVRFSGETSPRILRAGRQEAAIGGAPSAGALVLLYLEEGAFHLATGYDHVLFLLSLVLAAGLVARAQGRRRALRDVAILVTAFTLGHSVTLAAAALEWIVLPSRLVESVIAASIIVVALANIWRPRERRAMPWLAGGFGLVHGFGFSSVLAEQGLPYGQRALALLSFNVGIELAQLAFVGVLLLPLAWLARFDGYERVVVRGGSIVIALLAAVWLLERVLG